MKHKTVGFRSGYRLFIRERETAFDKFNKKTDSIKSSFGIMEDHIQMNTYEFAAFQKKMFREKRRQKKRGRILIFVSFILAICLLLLLPYIIETVFDNSYLDLVL